MALLYLKLRMKSLYVYDKIFEGFQCQAGLYRSETSARLFLLVYCYVIIVFYILICLLISCKVLTTI